MEEIDEEEEEEEESEYTYDDELSAKVGVQKMKEVRNQLD